ncbi:MAG: bifunctional proline dehydrogenase/L-glutamate gamma-semialdehyde dehydrogenase PutA, partial [Magnetospirillum sp.]|nr:bifunctional proline dehydrogenase/L-glutamate gamma-semialdehyde dehydrogenase PutA [Magnetospirillum sp.]
IERIVNHPVNVLTALSVLPNPRLPLPPELYAPERRNSRGWDLTDPETLSELQAGMARAADLVFMAAPLVGGAEISTGPIIPVVNPADIRKQIGSVREASDEDVNHAVNLAVDACRAWDRLGGDRRASILERAADLYETAAPELMMLAIREAGKTIPDAVAELREAVDFLRYYAAQARAKFTSPIVLPGVTGETNLLELHGRGVFACISPWNFPLAIFTGQVAAALAAGNAVVAKPAEQTPLIAARAVRLLHDAGVPADVLGFVPGDGRVGEVLVNQPGIAGVAFTGSTEVARLIARALAAKDGPIATLVAETGGINAMIVDSSALPEQVVGDVITSAFGSAGQRCSALRMLFLQDDIAAKVRDMLAGAMTELSVGDPANLATDVGPVIDAFARDVLETHAAALVRDGNLLAQSPLPAECRFGTFSPPRAFVLDRPQRLEREVFGPCLHVVRYGADRLHDVLEWIRGSGYGLTLGIHSRIDSFQQRIRESTAIGNIYVNRSMIGAVVGSQPFGGEGLSGTGPKAGGPHSLYRFACERSVAINTSAAGGNAALLAEMEE